MTASAAPVRWGLIALAYAGLILYGSLFPFVGWTDGGVQPLAFLNLAWPRRLLTADVVTNVLAYVPFGFFLARLFGARTSSAAAAVSATMVGAALSFGVEFLQQYLPGRTASSLDLATNTVGTLIGAALSWPLRADGRAGRRLQQWRNHWFTPGRMTDLGLVAIGLWALSQLTPLVPSLDIGNLRHGIAPLWHTLLQPTQFKTAEWLAYSLNLTGLALLARLLALPGRSAVVPFTVFVAAVLMLKIPVISRQLSAEAIAGALTAVVLMWPLAGLSSLPLAWVGAAFVLGGFTVDELAAASGGVMSAFSWIPFRAQLENPLVGIASILETIWPAAVLACFARIGMDSARTGRRSALVVIGGVALGLLVLGLEWQQQFRPGRVGDATTVLLMIGTWFLFGLLPLGGPPPAPRDIGEPVSISRRRRAHRRSPAIGAVLGFALVALVAGVVLGRKPPEVRVDESKLPRLPAPDQLPPAVLPDFRYAHPRLPSPSSSELELLQRQNPRWLRDLRARAKGGAGDLQAALTQARIDPGSVDLDLLHGRLMGLEFQWRGHEQGRPLALAYDWLFDEWTEAQRAQLRGKLIAGCNHIIERIRQERLSPYNVYLYNAPFQALMACALAVYGDDPGGEPVMRFTYDLWKHRVLPVWQQVMGPTGGWHEGGEYVGIGIGQAIHQVPAMWRSATGEDLFASEPGVRGFLDFLVYRTRPDGTHFRWGDGAHFDRLVPDALPLALEYRHAAAYGLARASKLPAPTGWPWGPLTDPSLQDPAAVEHMPLTHFFEGIGMLVARSDWTPEATYVTFKAGDNYWSHVHLDQGAFTIYKGGELAIDSGLYGPKYGSDHHMNYAYQTIAHNTVTVTDPADTVPAPGKDTPRLYANDGGQRRIGSGWGIEAAPLDLAEWESKRDIYHSGQVLRLFDENGFTVAVADITPAYTNSQSGNGTFSHRTRRVERFWRTFAYDRLDDVVVVFDQVTATKASFRKRWLLHSVEEPQIVAGGFSVRVAPQDRPGRAGGVLEAKVLLPKAASITSIGGRGLEFFVDDKNYDENGTLAEVIRKRGVTGPEPGAWRVEVSPPSDARDDVFLVVLLPGAASALPPHRVRLLESNGRVGCEVAGPRRTTQWWFTPGKNGAEIKVVAGEPAQSFQVTAPPLPGR